MRLNSLAIVPVLFITALLRFTKAWANSGFFCIVNTELGQNPNVSLKKETNSWKWPLLQLIFMTILAYFASLFVFQILN